MLKVLIVDDEAVVRRGIVLGVDWASMGCVVVGEASNGEEGIAAAEQYSPNLIITDVRMPKMDGIAMMQELRRRGSRAHVIMLTAYSDFDYARSALQFGADDYLLKPFQDKELVAAIERIHRKEQEKSGIGDEQRRIEHRLAPLAKSVHGPPLYQLHSGQVRTIIQGQMLIRAHQPSVMPQRLDLQRPIARVIRPPYNHGFAGVEKQGAQAGKAQCAWRKHVFGKARHKSAWRQLS